jgi:glycosyltransferase involved in cell wall biosynthesis
MFLPTLLECFSASYAEAMAMKTPILTSDMGFAHTVCQDAALFFNPLNPNEIADKIISLADSPELQKELVKHGTERLQDFGTSEDRARQILEICRETVESYTRK